MDEFEDFEDADIEADDEDEDEDEDEDADERHELAASLEAAALLLQTPDFLPLRP